MRTIMLAGLVLFLADSQSGAVQGDEVTATVTLLERHIRADAKLVAPMTPTIRSVIVIMQWGVGGDVYGDPAWREFARRMDAGMLLLSVESTAPVTPGERLPPEKQAIRNAALGGGDALLAVIDRMSQHQGLAELKKAPLLLWGFSAAGSFVTTFATAHPDRTVGIVRYHSHSRQLPLDMAVATTLPVLLIAGGEDKTAGVDDARELAQKGREVGAPWTLAVHPGQQHGRGLAESRDLMLAWVDAILRQRLAGGRLQRVSAGWLGDASVQRVFASSDSKGPSAHATWLPDERSATLWQALISGGKASGR